ncbi:MAG: peptide chain release factor N(5)-glutamine methyltransferase [Endomicrobium sp.]|jgi:release factor glutamine methyltransferase|nr:peptide chain release factor N(5)-glutamine methyltransferase [Endomicrobium sp.]
MFGNERNIYTILKIAEVFLISKGLFDIRCDVEILLSSVLKIDRTRLYSTKNNITDIQKSIYANYIVRRSKREPVAYILGVTEFMYFDFIINENVFIPRPETEILVDSVLEFSKNKRKLLLLDLCTGSGCIAISLRKLGKFKDIIASDINENAIEIAVKNAKINDVSDIAFIKSNIFDDINGKMFDIIVSNPPYVSFKEYNLLEPEIKYEPKNALIACDDGLFFYRKIIDCSNKYLKNNGVVFVELNSNKYKSIELMFLNYGYKNIKIIKDYAGLPRVLKAEK